MQKVQWADGLGSVRPSLFLIRRWLAQIPHRPTRLLRIWPELWPLFPQACDVGQNLPHLLVRERLLPARHASTALSDHAEI